MKNNLLRNLGLILPLLIIAVGIGLHIVDPLPLQTLRNNVFDQFQRWSPRVAADLPVVVVDIDEASLQRLGQWPWPRTRLAELVSRLQAAEVAAIGFDMLFAEPDRTTPQAMAANWPLPDAIRSQLRALPDHDDVLAKALASADVAMGFVLQSTSPSMMPSELVSPYRLIWQGEAVSGRFAPFSSVSRALPKFEANAKGYGALNFVADSDGVIRRVPLFLNLAGQPVPSLAAEVLRLALGERNYVLKTDNSTHVLESVRIGPIIIPTTASGEAWLHYAESNPARYLPAWKVLDRTVAPDRLAGHIVIVGSSAPGLMDLRFSPLRRIIPGVEVHAQALEQILAGQMVQRPVWAIAVEVLSILIGGLMVAFLSIRSRALSAAGSALSLSVAALLGSWVAFSSYGLLINTVTPALIFMTAFVLGSLIHHWISERETGWIKGVFSRYVSPNRVNYLMTHPEGVELGGERRECSFIFTDLANFTALMESIEPEAAVDLLNRYLDQMIDIAFHHDGTLDRIVGDALAIMFSAPVAQSDHRQRALSCALAMDAFAVRYAEEERKRGLAFGKTRIGIHSGTVIIGNFGGNTMFDYRALGDPVNTAARLESVNKFLGTTVCISEATLSGCAGVEGRPVGRLVLKGKSEALQTYEPLTERNRGHYAPEPAYREAYQKMAGGDVAGALARFSELARLYPDDPLLVLHQRRLVEGAMDDLVVLADK